MSPIRTLLTLACSSALLLTSTSSAQTISLVSALPEAGRDYQLCEHFAFNGSTFFTTYSPDSTTTLFRMAGETMNVSLLHKWKGRNARYVPMRPVVFKGRFWFPQTDSLGQELWSSDGTPAGTGRVADLNPGPDDGALTTDEGYPEFGGKLYVAAYDSNYTGVLWQTDGTAGGTAIAFAFPDQGKRITGVHFQMPVFRHMLAFFATDTSATGLYMSDGDQSTTRKWVPFSGLDPVILNDRILISPYASNTIQSTDGVNVRQVSGRLTFTQDRLVHNSRLYFFDKAALHVTTRNSGEPTQLLKLSKSYDGIPVPLSAMEFLHRRHSITPHDGRVYFGRDSAIWATDGTIGGTTLRCNVPALGRDDVHPTPFALTSAEGRLYFKIVDAERVELYEFVEGSETPRKLSPASLNYTEPDPVARALNTSIVDPMFIDDGNLYFTAVYDSTLGKALYRLTVPTLSAQAESRHAQLTVVPNPANGSVQIQIPKTAAGAELRVTDLSGRTLITRRCSNTGSERIDVSGLPSGVYGITLLAGDQSIHANLIVR